MVDIEDFSKFKYIDYGKVFLVLYFKGFSWKKELQNEFNISSSIVDKALLILENNGYIISKDFWSLDLDTQEAIKCLNAGYSYLLKTHPKIYTLSLEGKEEAELTILSELKEKAKKHSSLRATIDFIIDKTNAYNKIKNKFTHIENNSFYRKRIDHSTGIEYETPTQKYLLVKKELESEIPKLKLIESQCTINKNIAINNNNISSISHIEIKKKHNKINQNIYNGKIINTIDLIGLEAKNNANDIEKEPLIVGKPELEVERSKYQVFEYLKKELLIKDFINRQEQDEEQEKCFAIIDKIKQKGWMDVFQVQRLCGNNKTYNMFLSIAKNNDIYDNGEDFVYKKQNI